MEDSQVVYHVFYHAGWVGFLSQRARESWLASYPPSLLTLGQKLLRT